MGSEYTGCRRTWLRKLVRIPVSMDGMVPCTIPMQASCGKCGKSKTLAIFIRYQIVQGSCI